MFTEQQHEAIAHVIETEGWGNYMEPDEGARAVEFIQDGLSAMFAADNSDFNPEQFAKRCQGEEIAAMDWDKAETHFKSVLEQYKELVGQPGVNVMFAMSMTFDPLLKRFNDGERTQDLYDAMLGVQ